MDPRRDDGDTMSQICYAISMVTPHNSGSEGLMRPGSMNVGAAECMLIVIDVFPFSFAVCGYCLLLDSPLLSGSLTCLPSRHLSLPTSLWRQIIMDIATGSESAPARAPSMYAFGLPSAFLSKCPCHLLLECLA